MENEVDGAGGCTGRFSGSGGLATPTTSHRFDLLTPNYSTLCNPRAFPGPPIVLLFPPQYFLMDWYTLSEAWGGVNWADLMAAHGAFGTDYYDRSTRTIVGTMLSTEYRPVIKIGPKGALGSHEIRPIHSAPSLGQSI